MNILEGRITLEKRDSDFNGELTVVKDLFYGTYILGGGLPQAGGLAQKIWRHTFENVSYKVPDVKNCLIMGLGGGGIAGLVRDNWPKAKITGIDIDPVIVELGKKYLKLDDQKVEVIIKDVNDFKTSNKYDLICIDTYKGDQYPKEFASEKFAKKINAMLTKDGMAIFNRLFGPEDRKLAVEHEKVLEKVFASVDRNYPEANVMFVCTK